jgi:dihydrodipicolinate synthase/N-acetylneuraminate lyase
MASPAKRREPAAMKALRASEIRGNWATLLLPIRLDESIDLGLFRKEIQLLSDSLVDGVYSNGTAGEFYAQTEAEFDEITSIVAEECGRRDLPFQIGASHPSPQISLARLLRWRSAAPSAFQVVLPDWFPPTLDDIHRFLDRVEAAADPVGLVLYNPPHAKRSLAPAEWLEIVRRHPGIQGAKVAGGDAAWYRDMAPVLERISVFVPGHYLATGLAQGARGAYSNVACLSPAGAQRWYELCTRDPAQALKWQEKIVGFLFAEVVPYAKAHGLSNMACDKALASAGGWLPGLTSRIRWPYAGFPQEEVDRLGRAAREAVPQLFGP